MNMQKKLLSFHSKYMSFLIIFCCSLTACEIEKHEKANIQFKKQQILTPHADGILEYTSEDAVIDASNASDGYIMIHYKGNSKKEKAQIVYPDGRAYLYTLQGGYEVFPLTGGDGNYTISILEYVYEKEYKIILTAGISVQLNNELSPFLYPNQYVNFSSENKAVQKAEELSLYCENEVQIIDSIYQFIIYQIQYDFEKAKKVHINYLPDIELILHEKKGICFDYAALMCAMLRSQGIPAKLEIGYSGSSYHAWVLVYSSQKGHIHDIISIHEGWTLLDPTYASQHSAQNTLAHTISNTYFSLYTY